MSKYFEPIGLDFSICSIHNIYDYHYITITDDSELEIKPGSPDSDQYRHKPYIGDNNMKDLVNTYHEPNTINIYYTQYLIVEENDTVAGLGTLPLTVDEDKKSDNVYISTNEIEMNVWITTHAHELGHFFGLYHTHEADEFGPEYADGSNCNTAGDLMCDTPAEPDLSEVEIEACRYVETLTDARGDYYIPNIGNMMSYGPKECRWGFSKEQYKRMLEIYYNFRTHLR